VQRIAEAPPLRLAVTARQSANPTVTRPLVAALARCSTLGMSTVRWYGIGLLAGVLVFGEGTAGAALQGGQPAGHVGGGSGRGARVDASVARPPSAEHRFSGRRAGDHRFDRGRRDGRRFFPYLGDVPYFDDEGYAYDEGYEPRPRQSPRSGYCDVSSNSFPQFCVWKPGP